MVQTVVPEGLKRGYFFERLRVFLKIYPQDYPQKP